MTDRLVADWNPEADLAALLDGLTEELLAAANHEIAPYLDEAAEERGEGADAIRRLDLWRPGCAPMSAGTSDRRGGAPVALARALVM
jgi:hypothetical protein